MDLGALKENEVSWLTWIGMVGWKNRAGWMVCVGSCFVDPHGLSCDFGASEKFACCVFFSFDHQDRSCKMTTVGMMLLNLVFMVGWEPFLLKSSLRSSPCAPFFDVCGISKGLHKKSLLRIRPRVVEKW